MIEEAITKVEELAREAELAKVVTVEGDPTMAYITHNGTLHKHPIPQVPDRKHEVQTLADLAEVVKDHGHVQVTHAETAADGAAVGEQVLAPLATVWHSDGEVVGLLGDEFRKDRVTMTLITSPVFKRLAELEKAVNHRVPSERPANHLDQRAFIRLLKFDFDKAGEFGQLIASARELKFTLNQGGESSLQQGRESMGKQVLAEVKGLAEFPEEFVVTYPVYVNPDLAQTSAAVTCCLEIDVASELFIVTPKPDELLAARQHVHQLIGETLQQLLAQEKVPVYYGKP